MKGSTRSKLASAGFEQIEVEPTRIYRAEDAREFLSEKGFDVDALATQVDGKFLSAFIRATNRRREKKTGSLLRPGMLQVIG